MQFPHNTQEVQEIVKKARRDRSGLVAVSSDAPHLHGASENANAESVSFSEMKSIMKIDRRSRYVRVEPGVTFGELIPKLREAGMKLNMPFLPRAGKSVTASALEREAILIPKYQYDFPDPLLTVETVFGTGDVFKTGSAAGPGTYEENKADKILPWGPGSIDYLRFLTAAQGTIGLVIWATLKTEVLPSASRLFLVESQEPSVLVKLAIAMCRKRIPDECIILNRANFSLAFSDNDSEETTLGAAAPWVMLCRVCGYDRYPGERVEIYSDYVRDACAETGLCAKTEFDFSERIEKMLTDCDRREVYWKLRKGDQSELDLCAAPDKASDIIAAVEKLMPGAGLTVSPQVQGRAFRIEVDLRSDEPKCEQERKLFELAEKLMPLGAYYDRPYGRLPELVYTDKVSVDAMRRIKKIFDPDGILNPGKLCF